MSVQIIDCRPYMCELCGAQFARSEYRARHIASSHYKGNSCKICFRIFPNNEELEIHMEEHTKKKVEVIRKIRPNIQKPMIPSLPIGYEQSILLRKHECDICHRRFIRKQHMMRHRDTHADIRRYQCGCCHKRFSRREYHEKHQNECSKKFNPFRPENGPTTESISASESSTSARIEDGNDEGNIRSDHDIGDSISSNTCPKSENGLRLSKAYPCDVCERVFARSDHLKRHRDTHSNFRPYNCSYCLRLFSRKENQKRHEFLCKSRSNACGENHASGSLDFGASRMVYDGNMSDDGEIEQASFVNDLVDDDSGDKNETITDSNETLNVEGNGAVYTIISDAKKLKVNSCPICSREFVRVDHLKRHIQTHDGFKRYQCQCCRKFFARQDYQVKHEKMCMIRNNYTKQNFEDHKSSVRDNFWKMSELRNECDDMSSNGEHKLNEDFGMHTMPDAEFNTYEDSVDNNETKYAMPELSSNEYKTLSCDTCSRVFQKRHHLRRHKIGHMAQKPFQCTDCDQKFTRPEHMKAHLLKRHNKIIKSRINREENENEGFLINKPTLRKKYIRRFTHFATTFADKTSANYFERCFDFVASMVIAHERGKCDSLLPRPPPNGKLIKNEPDAELTGLFINVEECPDPLELYDENDIS